MKDSIEIIDSLCSAVHSLAEICRKQAHIIEQHNAIEQSESQAVYEQIEQAVKSCGMEEN